MTSQSNSVEATPPAADTKKRPYSLGEEIANAITHGLGVGLSIVAMTLLVASAAIWGNGWHLSSAIVYGVTMLLLYVSSTLYHSIPGDKARHVLKIIDHSSIYLLIAGTYTPFTLVTLRESGGWWLFGVVWSLAIVGVALEAFWVYRPKWVSAVVYLGMGWLVVVVINPLVANLPSGGLWLLVAGGLAYTLGTIFYVLKRVPYTHAVWHLFVLAGSVCHFLAVMLYVLPTP
ncbi:MAG: hemolysin III [Actinobacteria bacterium HGW-Actinobacteria-6]|jgi:hemolysin III|nr:MAG: hemolysin III [Actinobacteria bacterium HGW-Actinobacteria-6]